jgi:hypothetical protein
MRVDPQFYMEDGSVRFSSGRSFFYADDNHLSQAGVEQLRPLITRTIVAIKEAAHSPAGAQDRITPNIQATFSASRFESTRQ